MNDAFGFVSVGNAGEQSSASTTSQESTQESTVDTGITTTAEGEAGQAASATPGAETQTDTNGAAATSTDTGGTAASSTATPETVYVDPFKDLGDTEKSIFDSIKNKDYKSLKDVLDAITTDYDQVSDIDLVRKQLKESKPRWTDEMIDTELVRKYGLGFDEAELNPQEALIYKMQLLDDADAARAHYKGQQAEIKFPELQSTASQVEAKTGNQMTPEQEAEFKQYWTGHIENSVKDLSDEVFKIEVGRDGNKEIFDFPINFTPEDKQSLKTLVSDFDINTDFQSRYVKDNVVDLKKFMSDRFKADNFDKLLKAAFAQGHSQGKLGQIKGDKNLDTGNTNTSSSTHDQVSQRSSAATFFFGNGRNK